MREIKKLDLTVTKNGIEYHQTKRTANVAMYIGYHDGTSVAIEVFQIKIKQADKFVAHDREAFPSNEDFGYSAWSYNPSWGVEKAEKRYQELNMLEDLEIVFDEIIKEGKNHED